MSLENFKVLRVDTNETYPWLLKKHYARRIPAIVSSYGLYQSNKLQGVCCFGPPPRMLNNGYGCFKTIEMQGYELNRLVINNGLPKNSLSYFVAHALELLPKPCFVVSYADPNKGHHGYIYQATNWLFTGQTNERNLFIERSSGKETHARTINSRLGTSASELVDEEYEVATQLGKYRYFKFLGNKRQTRSMTKDFAYKTMPYPKGNNDRYDAGFNPETQLILW